MRLLVLLILSFTAQAAPTLEAFCKHQSGEMRNYYQCPLSRIPLPVSTCVFLNLQGQEEFVNGCSGPTGGHKSIFLASCIQHDLCYHHEPATNGRTQKDCDQEFYESTQKACEYEAEDIEKCKKWSVFMYRSLRVIGKPAFYCANENRNL